MSYIGLIHSKNIYKNRYSSLTCYKINVHTFFFEISKAEYTPGYTKDDLILDRVVYTDWDMLYNKTGLNFTGSS